jgi:hypothetical protein
MITQAPAGVFVQARRVLRDWFRKRHNVFMRDLVEQCLQEYARIKSACSRPEIAEIDAIIEEIQTGCTINSSRLFRVESIIIEKLDANELKLRIAANRDILASQLTRESYSAISRHFLRLPEEADLQKLRAEAHSLSARIHRRYSSVPNIEVLRARLARRVLWRLVAYIALLGLPFWIVTSRFWPDGALASLTIFSMLACGAAGASISTLIRLYQIDPRHEPGSTWLSLISGQGTILIAPALGIVFALIMLMLVLGDILSGGIFPNMHNANPFGESSLCFNPSNPACREAATNFCRLLVWGFIAGWAERTVPDVLDRLAPQASSKVSAGK